MTDSNRAHCLEPRVSVVIPTFDRRRSLERAIESVLAQTRPADEIIVVDDGSNDDTVSAIARGRYPVRLVRQANRGVSAARNLGVRAASGTWLAFLDSDDEWHPHKLARQLEASSPDCRIVHCDERWFRHGRRVNPKQRHRKRGGWIYEHCLALCVISPSAVMIHREVFATVGGFDETLPACEDYDLWLRVCARFAVTYIDEPLLDKFGGHDDQLSRRFWGMDRFRIRALSKALADPAVRGKWRALTARTLIDKIDIYAQGARKRARFDEIQSLEIHRSHAQSLVRQSLVSAPS